MINVGIVGYGYWGPNLVRNFSETPGSRVRTICELRKDKLDKAGRRERVALLRGLDEAVLSGIAERLQLSEGAEQLIRTLKALGYKTAILSGGFTYFGHYLQQRLGIDYVHANELEIQEGRVTGNVIGRVVDGQRKAELLREIAQKEGVNLEQVIAVGDGANDLPMMQLAGLSVAYRAKPKVREYANVSIDTGGLNRLLEDPGARAMYLFPTKALAQDQLAELNRWTEKLGDEVRTFTYDGDTPQDARRAIRSRARCPATSSGSTAFRAPATTPRASDRCSAPG